jgi:hypothetical protein
MRIRVVIVGRIRVHCEGLSALLHGCPSIAVLGAGIEHVDEPPSAVVPMSGQASSLNTSTVDKETTSRNAAHL